VVNVTLAACCTLFVWQFFTLTRPTLSGAQVRLDFIGRLESLSEDWERLKVVMGSQATKLAPEDRRSLILSHAEGPVAQVPQHRASANSSHFVPFSEEEGHPEHFTLLHVVLVCRRYIQDLVCFDMGVPQICIDHTELVMDLLG